MKEVASPSRRFSAAFTGDHGLPNSRAFFQIIPVKLEFAKLLLDTES
jgi:hypothetical protein